MEEYDRNAPDSAVEKRKFLQEEQAAEKPEYINVTFQGDIELTAGQTYLFYANYNETHNRYELLGYEYGSRELDGFNTKTRSSNNQTTILSNDTNEKEDFETYVQKFLK